MADIASQTAFDNFAPVDERTEALSQLQSEHMPSASDLLPASAVREFMDMVKTDLHNEELRKSIMPEIVDYPSKASRENLMGMKSVRIDETQINMQGEYWERPSAFSFDSLRMMVDRTPILNAVIMTRVRQVQRFCSVADSGSDAPGFEIRHVDRAHQLTKAEQESISLLQKFVLNCGWEFKPRLRKKLHRDTFSQFVAKAVRDSLTLDSCGVELEWKRDKQKGIDGFYAVDGSTIRLCAESGYRGDEEIFALQLVQGQICTAYTYDDLIYEPRNPRSDVNAAGYGLSETELLVRVVTGYLNAMTYNIEGFDNNSIPKGMLHLVGNYGDADLRAFKRYWSAMVKGISNAWTLPVMVSKDEGAKASFERFGVEFNEMYFSKWMTFLTSIICALYGMSPAEINFDSFSGGNTSPLAGSDTEEKLTASKDSGLRPILSYLQNLMSDYVIGDFSDKYVLRFTGLDPEDADKKHEKKKLILTWDEMRAEEGHKAIGGEIGSMPVNPAFIGPWQQSIGQQPAPEQEGQSEEDGAAGQKQDDEDQNSQNKPESRGQKSDNTENQQQDKDFGSSGQDFGKSFGLPEIYSLMDM